MAIESRLACWRANHFIVMVPRPGGEVSGRAREELRCLGGGNHEIKLVEKSEK